MGNRDIKPIVQPSYLEPWPEDENYRHTLPAVLAARSAAKVVESAPSIPPQDSAADAVVEAPQRAPRKARRPPKPKAAPDASATEPEGEKPTGEDTAEA